MIQRSSTAPPANAVEPQHDSRAARGRAQPSPLVAAPSSLCSRSLPFWVSGSCCSSYSVTASGSSWTTGTFSPAGRATDLGDLLRPHNEHWSTLPILVYRVLWQLFGLRTYVPYQLVALLLTSRLRCCSDW